MQAIAIWNKLLHYNKSDIISFFIILYAFLIPISKHGFRTVTIILLLLWFLDSNLKNKILYIFKNKVFISITIFIGYSFLSLVWSSNVTTGLTFLSQYWYLSALLILITNIKTTNIPKIISAFLFGMLVSEILSYGIFFELWTLRHGTPMNPSPYMYHTFYGLFLAFTALLLLNKIYFQKTIKDKLVYIIFFITVSSNLFLNSGRTGYFAFTVTIFVLGFLNMKNKIISFLSMSILVISIFVAASQFSPIFNKRFDQAKNELIKIYENSNTKYNGSFGNRLAVWIVGIEIFKDNPILGTGAGAEMDALQNKIKTTMPEMKIIKNIWHFHNDYISYLVQLGIIGLILYTNIFYQLLKIKIEDKELNNLKYIFVVVFSVASLVDFMFIGRFTLPLFVLFAGIFISASTVSANHDKAKDEIS